MITLAEIDKTLQAFEQKYGLTVRGAQQQSEAWFRMRLGVVTASNAYRAIAKVDSDTRATYVAQLVAQVCTGVIEETSFKQANWGVENEDAARSSYEFATGETVTPLTFVFKDESFRMGGSPDGRVQKAKGFEIKCPWDSTNYVKFVLGEDFKREWTIQNQFNMWVTDAQEWDFVMFDPRMKKKPLHMVTIERDPKMMAVFEELIPKFIMDMDKALAQIGVKYGEQWTRIAAKERETA